MPFFFSTMLNRLVYKAINLVKSPTTLNIAHRTGYISNWTEITPNLYLGNLQGSQDEDFLKSHGITAIVNCTKDEPFHPYFTRRHIYRCDVEDSRTTENIEAFRQKLYPTVAFLENQIANGRTVYVHCYWGLMRSATVVAAYLIKTKGMTPEEAKRYVKERRPKALSSLYNYNEILQEFYQRVHQIE